MFACKRCDLPAELPDGSRLYLAPPLSHTVAQFRKRLVAEGVALAAAPAGVLAIALGPEQRIGQVASLAREALSESEIRDTRSLIVACDAPPTIANLGAMEPLPALLARLDGEWLAGMIRDARLAMHFQPMVGVVDGRPGVAHEALLRGVETDGSLVSPGRMYDCARAADLLFPLDKAARTLAVREASRLGIGGLLFVNFLPSSIYDPVFCLRTTVAAADEAGIAPERVVFEVVESEKSGADLPRIFRVYRDAGFRVALDDLGAGFGSLNLLHELRPDFVKLDMQLLRDVDRDPYKAAIASKIVEMARKLGIQTVAEGIETEGEWAWVRDHGFDLAQGFLFARPASPPAVLGDLYRERISA